MAWLVLVPFVAYALPYVLALERGSAGLAPATFTVDEPLYLGEARALARGSAPEDNPWTRRRGMESDAYRLFCGSMVFAAGWEFLGGDPTWGLAVAAGLCAALSSLAAYIVLRSLLRGAAARAAVVLAPLVVMGPWDCLGELVRLRVDLTRLQTFLPLGRPFTSQWGLCLYLLSLACSARVLDRVSTRTLVAFTVVGAAQCFTFPYAVPAALLVWTVAVLRSPRRETTRRDRTRALWIPPLATLGFLLATLWLDFPASAEADHGALASPRFGGSGILLAGLGLFAWLHRAAFPPAARWFLPSVAGVLLLCMLAGHVVPGRLHVIEHVTYLYGVTVAMLVLALLATVTVRERPVAAGPIGIVVAAAALVLVVLTDVATAGAHEGALARRAAWAASMRRLPDAPPSCLLVEGEDLDGPGAWSALLSPIPVFYAYTSEYSTKVSLDDRRWRRAWYLHFRGLMADQVAHEGASIAARFTRFFGAHNTVPGEEVLRAMEDKLRRIEAGDASAFAFLAGMGRILCLEDPRAPTFVPSLLEGALIARRTSLVGPHRFTEYEARVR